MANTGNCSPHGNLCTIFTPLTLPTIISLTPKKIQLIVLYQEKKKVTTKTTEMKRTRRDRREMEEVMFNLFERQSHWTLRNLIQDTDQPEVNLIKGKTLLYSA